MIVCMVVGQTLFRILASRHLIGQARFLLRIPFSLILRLVYTSPPRSTDYNRVSIAAGQKDIAAILAFPWSL